MKYRRGTFSTTPNKELMRGKPTELQAVHFWLCERSDDNGLCYPSRPRIAADSGIKSLRTVDKYINVLIEMGILVKTKRKNENGITNKSNLYQIMVQEMHDPEQELLDGSAIDAHEGSAPNGTVTIPTINNTQLTIIADVPSDANPRDETDPLAKLPEKYGKTMVMRLHRVYSSLWSGIYGISATMPIGRLGKAFNAIASQGHSEMQIAVLLHAYFGWRGGSGTDNREYEYLVNAGFPIEMMIKKIDIMVAYLTNGIGLEYTSPAKVREYASNALKNVL